MAGGPFTWEVLIPTHRIVFGLLGGEVVESRAASSAGTFAAYRKLDGAVPGMIAWPNTVLLHGDEPIVVDPGYQTQGDMLAGALRAQGIEPGDVRTVVMTHLHSDHLSALPQLPGVTEVWVHEDELGTPYERRQRGITDEAPMRVMHGAGGGRSARALHGSTPPAIRPATWRLSPSARPSAWSSLATPWVPTRGGSRT